MSPSLRRSLPFALGVLLILAAVPAGYLLLLREPPAPVAPVRLVEPGRAPVALRLGELSGAVEVRRGGAWMQARPGELLRVTDAVRTLAGGSALLLGGPSLEVRMTPGCSGKYWRRNSANGRSPMKHMPVLSFFSATASPALRAISRTSLFASSPSGISTSARSAAATACRK